MITATPLFLSARDCQALLSPPDVLAAIEQALHSDAAGAIRWPTPRNLNIAPDGFGNDYHVKACVLEDVPIGGFRVVSHPPDEASGLATRLIILTDPNTTLPLAIVDERWNFLHRTVAAILIGVRHLAAGEPRTLALVGAGRLATTALTYYTQLFNLTEVRINSRRPASREALARLAAEQYGLDAHPVASAEEAVRGAELILTCTNSEQAVLEERWVAPGAVVAALTTSEPGPALVEAADLFVVDSREQLHGELIEEFGPAAPGWIDATIGEIVTGQHPGRTDPAQRALVITQGMASHDIALAHRAYLRAVAEEIGTPLPMADAD